LNTAYKLMSSYTVCSDCVAEASENIRNDTSERKHMLTTYA